MTRMTLMPMNSARGYVFSGSRTSPATYVNSIHPVYVNSTATSDVQNLPDPSPVQVIGCANAPCDALPSANRTTARIASARTLVADDTVCSVMAHGTDRAFASVSAMMR